MLFNLHLGWVQTVVGKNTPLTEVEKRQIEKGVRAAREDDNHVSQTPVAPPSSGSSVDTTELLRIVCDIKRCVNIIKKRLDDLEVDCDIEIDIDDPCWASLVDAIEECQQIGVDVELPENFSDSQALQACGLAEILERLGCFECPDPCEVAAECCDTDSTDDVLTPETVLGCLCFLKK